MPQTTVEKKFFHIRVSKIRQNLTYLINQIIAITKFQEFQKNIAGGAE
jgi:hypothetical protein